MATIYPFLEILQIYGSYHCLVIICPVAVIIREVSCLGIVSLIETKHYLMLIKAAVLIILVHHEHPASVPPVNIVREEHVYVVSVHALRATDVAVGVLHSCFPLVTVGIHTAAHTAFRLLDSYIEHPDLNMTFLVIPGFFLRFGRIYIHFRFRCCDFFS